MPNYNVMITELRSQIVKIRGDDPKYAERETRKKWESAEPGYRLSEKDLAAVYFTEHRVFPKLVNTQRNLEMISGMAHREILDLTVIYDIELMKNDAFRMALPVREGGQV